MDQSPRRARPRRIRDLAGTMRKDAPQEPHRRMASAGGPARKIDPDQLASSRDN